MLTSKDVIATIGVRDMAIARPFYEGKLGLTARPEQQPGVVTFRSGSTSILVYESQYAGTNRATAATWFVGADIGAIVSDLQSRGVGFEDYDFPEAKREGPIYVFGTLRTAWFKDPDGNTLAIVSA